MNRLLVLALLLLTACSSIKPPIEPQAKLNADTWYNQGLKWEAKRQFDDATVSYNRALDAYRSVAQPDGVVASTCAQARMAWQAGNVAAYDSLRGEASQYLQEVAAHLAYQIVVLDVYRAQQEKDYAGVIKLARIDANYPLAVKVQLASAQLQAQAHLHQNAASLASNLDKYAHEYRKQLKKETGNAELYSLALYSLAFYEYSQGNYAGTLQILQQSNKIDYQWENLLALGHGWWLQGQAESALGKKKEALSSLRKAEGIFIALNDPEALEQVQDLMAKQSTARP